MKKISDTTKNIFILIGYSFLAIFVVFGVWILTKEPSTEFAPMPEEIGPGTDTWEEDSYSPEILASNDSVESASSELQDFSKQPIPSEKEIDSEDTSISLSDSTIKKAEDNVPPKEKPVTTDSLTNPDKPPEYNASVPLHTETDDFKEPVKNDTAAVTSSGQVYDPVFGWIQTGDTNQNVVDSSGDINKQIGTMGN